MLNLLQATKFVMNTLCTAVCECKLDFCLFSQERMKEQSPNILREIVINLDVGSLAVRMSPSLVHSVTMMSYLCRYDDNSRQTIVCSHFIICNNTVENLQLRQV